MIEHRAGLTRPEVDIGAQMTKVIRGVVFALAADDEYQGMAHVWVRDVETAYWFSLSRAVDSNEIELMFSDQICSECGDLWVTLFPTGISVKLNSASALTPVLDGQIQYAIEFHPESDDFSSIRGALEVILRGKPGLTICA